MRSINSVSSASPWLILFRVLGCFLAIVLLAFFSTTAAHPERSKAESRARSALPAPLLPRGFTLPSPPFSPGSAWNQSITAAAVAPTSDEQVLVTYRVLLGDDGDLSPGTGVPYWEFPYVNHDEYAIPVFRAGAQQASVLICDYEGYLGWTNPKLPIGQEGGPVSVPAPAGAVRPSGPANTDADGHLVLYDPTTATAHDFWQATTARDGPCQSHGGGLVGSAIFEAGMIDVFDVSGDGTNPDGYSSARATGTPLLAGLITPEDVEAGAIAHALAFAVPGPRNLATDPYEPLPSDYFTPTATTEGDFYSTNPDALAAGQRIRLKPTIVDDEGAPIDENDLAPITRMFLAALREYGAILVDNAAGFTFYAEDVHTAVLDLSGAELRTLTGLSSLPSGKTGWQIAIETLNLEMEQIPFAYGPSSGDPALATITTANFQVVAPVYLAVDPPVRAIAPGGVATYTVSVTSGGYTGTVSLAAGAPAPDLLVQFVPDVVAPPAQAALVVTSTHPGPDLLPGLWAAIPITATGGTTQTASADLLVGGARVRLPVVLRGY